jgi:hypothetical protein
MKNSVLNAAITSNSTISKKKVSALAGKSYWGGKLSTVYLLVLTSLDQLIFILKILFSFFTKQGT